MLGELDQFALLLASDKEIFVMPSHDEHLVLELFHILSRKAALVDAFVFLKQPGNNNEVLESDINYFFKTIGKEAAHINLMIELCAYKVQFNRYYKNPLTASQRQAKSVRKIVILSSFVLG